MNHKKTENFRIVLKYLPERLSCILKEMNGDNVSELCEIRLKSGLPVVLVFTDKMSFITESGRFTGYLSGEVIKIGEEEINEIFIKMCKYSVYAISDNISDGFITLENGCRVGVYGTAVVKSGKVSSVRNIKGLNIRISGYVPCVADKIADLYKNNSINTLICGPPASGKTTVLKDLCRTLSDKMNYRVCVMDERYEFDGIYLGANTDVLNGYPKKSGIMISVRTLSPNIIVCDELGDSDEVRAVLDGLNCGVNFVMTLHCADYDSLIRKQQFRLLEQSGVPDYVVFLKDKGNIDKIVSAQECNNESCCFNTFMYDKRSHRTVFG